MRFEQKRPAAVSRRTGPRVGSLRWPALAVAVATGAALAFHFRPKAEARSPIGARQPLATLPELLTLPRQGLAEVPIARMNLLCAQGLSAPNEPSVEARLAAVASWAERVRSETDRHWYRFRQQPGEFEHSEGFFRMLMLAVVLAEDFGVHYDPQRKASPANARMDDGFFANARDVFLHGLLGPERQRSCSSMPVLYVAVGRQLGYPLKLVTTKGHMFVRWDGAGERFNIEATGHGLNRFDDDYYRHWPFEVSPAEEAAEGYLRSLTPPEELAVFLSIRGLCQREAGKLSEAAHSFAAAARLAPGCRGYQEVLANLEGKLRAAGGSTKSLAKTH
jgi:hypothetical protein